MRMEEMLPGKAKAFQLKQVLPMGYYGVSGVLSVEHFLPATVATRQEMRYFCSTPWPSIKLNNRLWNKVYVSP